MEGPTQISVMLAVPDAPAAAAGTASITEICVGPSMGPVTQISVMLAEIGRAHV